MKRRVLITGHLGFIGRRLYKEMEKIGYDVYGADILSGCDTRHRLQLDKVFEESKPELVFHLAALAGVAKGEEYPDEYISTNILGTQNVVDMCIKHDASRLIFYSSSSVIGGVDENGAGADESTPVSPRSLYAVTKVAGEMIVGSSGIPFFIVRPFTVYGENGRPDMVIYKWINQIKGNNPISFYGNGSTQRGYTHVDDLAKATIKLSDYMCSDEIFHLGGIEVVSLNELLDIFKKHCSKKGIKLEVEEMDIPNSDIKHSYANVKKAQLFLQFDPKPRFKTIVNKILERELK